MSELIATDGSQVVTSEAEQLVTLTMDNQVFDIPILAVQDIVKPLKNYAGTPSPFRRGRWHKSSWLHRQRHRLAPLFG